jgi:hypothetical protein
MLSWVGAPAARLSLSVAGWRERVSVPAERSIRHASFIG